MELGQYRAFMPSYNEKSGHLAGCASKTDRQTLKDRAIQLLRSWSGALVTQSQNRFKTGNKSFLKENI